MAPEAAFTAATVGVLPLYALMIGAGRWRGTRTLAESPAPLAALAALWGATLDPQALLAAAAAAPAAFPGVGAVAGMFAVAQLCAASWVHLLLFDLCVARWVYLDALAEGFSVSPLPLVLCCMVGPLGLVAYLVERHIRRARACQAAAPTP